MAETRDDGQQLAQEIFQEMINKGNRVAEIRKAEFDFLERTLHEFTSRVQDQELHMLSWASAMEAPLMGRADPPTANLPQLPPLHAPPTSSNAFLETIMDQPTATFLPIPGEVPAVDGFDFFDNTGISSDVFFNIVDQMGNTTYSTTDGFT